MHTEFFFKKMKGVTFFKKSHNRQFLFKERIWNGTILEASFQYALSKKHNLNIAGFGGKVVKHLPLKRPVEGSSPARRREIFS